MAVVNHHRLIQGHGTSEPAWESWLESGGIGSRAMEEWLPVSARLVVVAPHSDDEVLACGGLMAMHREQGGTISVIAVTDGEASHADSPFWQPRALAATRRAESIAGLHQLGVSEGEVTRLAMPDGRLDHHTLRLALRLQLLLRPSDLVLTTWRFDGHPDHDATGVAASLACAVVGCRLIEAPVWMWHWASPGDPFVPWHRLHRLPLKPTARARKQVALAAHASQLDPSARPAGPLLGPAIVARANREHEYFFVETPHAHAAYG